jgi:hypothetical protein
VRGEVELRGTVTEVVDVEGDEFADTEPGIVQEREGRLVPLLELLGSGMVTRCAEVVDLVGTRPHFRTNLGVCSFGHGVECYL